jgi:two-component sensor histidine kinase
MDAGNLQLVVSDDGVGIPEDFDIDNATSLGLQLIQLLSEQISAELVIQRKNPTRFVLNIPQQR